MAVGFQSHTVCDMIYVTKGTATLHDPHGGTDIKEPIMRACRLAACIAALTLAIVLATAEATAAVTETVLPSPLRNWLLAGCTVTIVAVCTTLIVERLDRVESAVRARRGARSDYAAIERQLRTKQTPSNVSNLYSEE